LITWGLSPPSIISNEEEFILQPDSMFNISCTGKRSVIWAEPLPDNAFALPGFYTSTLFIYNATVENTGYYMCTYETFDGEPEQNEAGIYVFVPDPLAPFVPESRENLIVPMDQIGVSISCRVSDPHYHVVLKSVVSGEERSVFYDNKIGFFGALSPGQYYCETTVNGETFQSVTYTVEDESKFSYYIWTSELFYFSDKEDHLFRVAEVIRYRQRNSWEHSFVWR
uniref:Ig-like domain-containing protein n=1 Tax=Periophthalmus magnuspinnatus TaxID=409849 RepID=A0A3B4BJK1_9GOBI